MMYIPSSFLIIDYKATPGLEELVCSSQAAARLHLGGDHGLSAICSCVCGVLGPT